MIINICMILPCRKVDIEMPPKKVMFAVNQVDNFKVLSLINPRFLFLCV